MKLLSSLSEAYRLIHRYPPLRLTETDYDSYWKDKRSGGMGALTPFQLERARWIERRIERGSRVLDYGCGDGGILAYLVSKKDVHPIGADISPHAINHIESKKFEALLLGDDDEQNIQRLPEVDHILLCEVLEHMQNPEKFLLSVLRKARRSVFFSIPNTGYFPYRLRMLSGKSVMQWRLHPGEHLRYWTVLDLRWWLRELGLEERSVFQTYEGIPGLSSLWGSLFAMGIVGEIRTDDAK